VKGRNQARLEARLNSIRLGLSRGIKNAAIAMGTSGKTGESDEAPSGGADSKNQRRHPRAKLQLLIQYRFDSLEDFLAEYSTDISAGGMFIRSEKPREVGSFVYLQFALRDGSRIIEGLGRVVHVNSPDIPGREAGMGVEFIDLDAESAATIEGIVARKLSGGK
jgi:type IV pilus assembly protein PilZ